MCQARCRAGRPDYAALEMSYNLERVKPPFPEAPHLQFGGLALWFTYPAGAVAQLVEPTRFTLPLATWFVGPAYDELNLRYPSEPLTIVLDLTLMLSRTTASRSVLLAKVRQIGARIERGALISPRVLTPAAARSIQASIAVISALGVKIAVLPSAAQAVAELGLRRAP